ncbi:hypothetical protein BAE44_0025744 [Dichanthelium oligosanthes]|uniref:Uncharacterized protein n=1 Tax=Dichanthelium oligosanthes TaxID=888268 RepID=A0A1E5UK61_9POAL|nr:hypothetical protein BAE44_0025744 [Dichanthelium oligosanthes]
MKTLCPRPGNGGKIHPSPAEDPIAAAFRLLPAATLVLVAGLTPEDQRVLAHLVTRSFLVGWDAATAPPPEQARGGGRRRRGHPPTVGCLCFECYGSFWTRWGCSPQHDRIHAALEAFEEHLNAAESAAASSSSSTPPSSKRRDKGKRGRAPAATPPPPQPPPPQPPMRSRPKSTEPPALEIVPEPSSPLPPSCHPPPPPPPATAACPSEKKENIPEAPPAEAKAEECGGEVAAEGEEERKRGWADVMGGVLNPRRWGIWSPAVESAT